MAIRKYISTCFLLGLVVMNNGESDISKNNAMEKCQSAFKPTVRFLHMMSTLASKTSQPFTISKSCTEVDVYTEIMAYLKKFCLDGQSNAGVCSYQELFGIFNAEISVRQGKFDQSLCLTEQNQYTNLGIVLHLKPPETPEPSIEPHRIIEFCENLITSIQGINHCQNCPASSPLSCDTVCATTRTTQAETTTPTTKTTAATTTSYIEHSQRQEKTTEDGLQTSAVVIISVVSFIAGILCTIITMFFIRYYRNRQKEPGAKEEGATLDDVPMNTKVGASSEMKMQSVEMTYERLTSNIGNNDKVIKEHVYHGLGTHLESNTQSDVTNKEGNISKEEFHGNFQQKNSQTGDHVYNALEIKEHAGLDLYKNVSAEAYNEHTYTGLANREDEGSVQLDECTGNTGTNDRSNEAHYFTLEKTNGNETRAFGGVVKQESKIGEESEDGLKDGDHDYFNLQKMDDSDLQTHKFKENDDVRIGETEENTYHILEKV